MRYIILIIALLLLFRINLYSQLLINEVTSAANSDWVELVYNSEDKDCMDISQLFVTMYYGTNEQLGTEPITIYSYDRPETMYNDRFVVIHLAEPNNTDETDITGDTNGNGYIDVYCNNYYNSLWNSDCVVAIDIDDDPSNGGIIDFMAFSNRDGSANTTIGSYIIDAVDSGQWQTCSDNDIQNCAVDITEMGLESFMSISRRNLSDTNSISDFSVTNYQTPGRDNIIKISKKGRKLFKSLKKRISIVPSHSTLNQGNIPLIIYENCSIRFRVFSITGVMLYESDLHESVPPGLFSFNWNRTKRKRAPTGLYIGMIEATGDKDRVSEVECIYLILCKSGK